MSAAAWPDLNDINTVSMNMHTRTLIGVILLIANQAIVAQDQVGCSQLLEDAREAYEAGMIELVPDLLNPCLESGLAGAELQEAYKLVINAYLFDYLPDRADNLMQEFVIKFPDYEPAPEDPGEFLQLLEKHREEDADRQVEEQRETQDREEQDERTGQERIIQEEAPVERKQFGSIGFILGGDLAFPQVTERYSTGDPSMDEGNFVFSVPGFHVGGIMNLNMGRTMEASFEIHYTRLHLQYDGEPFSFASYTCQEYQNWLGVPVSLAVTFNPRSRVKVYMRLGVAVEYLVSANVSAIRSYTETGTTYLRDVELENVDISDAREPINLLGTGGLGIKFPFSGGNIFVEPRFNYGFFMTNDPEHRYDTQDLTWLIYHVDSDFKVNYLTLSFGMAWNLYRSSN